MGIELGILTGFNLKSRRNQKTNELELEVTLKVSPHSEETIRVVESVIMSETLTVLLETLQPRLT